MPRAIQIPLRNSRHTTRNRFYNEDCPVGTRIVANARLVSLGYPHYERREVGWYATYPNERAYPTIQFNMHYYITHPNLRPDYTLELATSSTLVDALEAYDAAP